ncbi:MAG: pilus assembly protein N-terminal domain-containing protein [Planctomycetes bacterium]|nr:pilus assembly protein N-terminal domain-containing protein [Planctomycetota bacterium]
MRMLDALNRAPARRKHSGGALIALGACAVVALGAALPLYGAGSQAGSALVEYQTNGGARDGSALTMIEGSLARLRFSRAISTDQLGVKLANADIASVEGGRASELLVTAKKVGRTNLIVWFKEGDPETYEIVVRRDLSVLESALRGIAGTISVQAAADRNALVLSGSVPDGVTAKRAEDAARAFAEAAGGDGGGKVINLLRVQTAVSGMESTLTAQAARIGAPGVQVSRIQRGLVADDGNDVFLVTGTVPDLRTLDDVLSLIRASIGDPGGKSSRIVNQVIVSDRPSTIDAVLERAIHEQLGHRKVKVARVSGVDTLGEADILVLTGTVASQTALVQTLALSAKVFQQQELLARKRNGEVERLIESLPGGGLRTTEKPLKLDRATDDVRVVADESGALTSRRDRASESGSTLRSILDTPGGGGFAGGGSAGLGRLLENRIESNIARAKAIELAEGRILSLIQVEDIPQVRVSIRLFELSRNDLLNWDSNINKFGVADFDTNGINPNTPLFGSDGTIVQNANGDPILFASNTDVSNVISFLESGFSNQIQIGGEHFNLDAVFRVLETESVARTLANPTLTVLSGEVAAFGDGGSVSVTSSVSTTVGGVNSGNAGVFESVQQLPFGIQLAVRPLVDEDGYITLDVAPSVSNPDFALTALVRTTTGTPQETVAFAEKNLRTSARVRDGEVLLIGGLQDRSRKDEAGKTPFLASIPILGWLFQDKKFEDKDRETMITVSPTIVRSAPPEARLWAQPSARELIGREPKPAPAAEAGPAGPAATDAKTPAKPAGK